MLQDAEVATEAHYRSMDAEELAASLSWSAWPRARGQILEQTRQSAAHLARALKWQLASASRPFGALALDDPAWGELPDWSRRGSMVGPVRGMLGADSASGRWHWLEAIYHQETAIDGGLAAYPHLLAAAQEMSPPHRGPVLWASVIVSEAPPSGRPEIDQPVVAALASLRWSIVGLLHALRPHPATLLEALAAMVASQHGPLHLRYFMETAVSGEHIEDVCEACSGEFDLRRHDGRFEVRGGRKYVADASGRGRVEPPGEWTAHPSSSREHLETKRRRLVNRVLSEPVPLWEVDESTLLVSGLWRELGYPEQAAFLLDTLLPFPCPACGASVNLSAGGSGKTALGRLRLPEEDDGSGDE